MEGMVNTCEPSLNVVMSTKPKILIGLSQKALEWVQGLDNTLSWTRNAPGGERAPNPSMSTLRNVVSPYCPWRCGYGGGKKRRPSCNGTDTGCNMTRRESGLTSLRCLGTRTIEESVQKVLQMAVACSTGATFPVRTSASIIVSCSQQVVSLLTGPSHGL